jgi:hypothetical protein
LSLGWLFSPFGGFVGTSSTLAGDGVERREQRARDRAILNWSKRAREAYGWSYRFWTRAEEKQVECGGTAKSKHCAVSAKPCSLL